jgi:chromosome partitioning protein
MLTVLVANIKGGCGKTTTATHLAAAFATSRLATALADGDRQRSSLRWLEARPEAAAPIRGLDWVKGTGKTPKVDRLVIDAPAAMRMGGIEALIEAADVVVVPMLPSIFDEHSTTRLLRKVQALKPVRKGKKTLGLVANRLRARSKAAARLEAFAADIDHEVVGRIPDRAVYADAAVEGLSVFDLKGARGERLRADWLPIVRFCEVHA